MRYLSYILGGVSAVAAGIYLVVYLYRWEWQRAVLSGVLLLAVGLFLVCSVLLGRLARLERRIQDTDARTEEIRRHLEESREQASAHPFHWLGTGGRPDTDNSTRTYVFVPILLVTGVVLTGVAWLIQRIAAASTRPRAERRLAGRLTPLAAPPGGARGALPQLEDLPAVPPLRRSCVVLGVIGSAAGIAVLVWGIGALADATETREHARPNAAATTVVFRVEVRGTSDEAVRAPAAHDLWTGCQRSTSSEAPVATLGRLSAGVYAGVIRPALNDHDVTRLRGCLSDTSVKSAIATVLGEGRVEYSNR